VRPEVFEKAAERDAIRAELGAGDRTVILSFGGSLGARRVNEVVADLCAWIPERERLPFTVSPVRNSSEPVIVPETPSLLFNIFVTSFRLVDWSAY